MCFRYDEKFVLGHRYRFRRLKIMVFEEESDEERDMTEEEVSVEENEREANLNSNSVMRVDSPKTMKLIGEIKRRKVIALIESGATHNFISENLVVELKISVQTTRYTIGLGEIGRLQG